MLATRDMLGEAQSCARPLRDLAAAGHVRRDLAHSQGGGPFADLDVDRIGTAIMSGCIF